jgi:hypothetical protein
MMRAMCYLPSGPLIGGSLLEADYRRRAAEKRCYSVGMVAARRYLAKLEKAAAAERGKWLNLAVVSNACNACPNS